MFRSLFKRSSCEVKQEPKAAKTTLLVTMLEVPERDHEEIIATISKRFSPGFKIVYLVSTNDFNALLAQNAAWEYFVPLEEQHQYRELMDWADYLAEKWNLLLIKWKPAKVIAYGTNVERFLHHSREIRKITSDETDI
ncbi:hypothetical protein [Roseibium sediminicola]|uniref:Uncharacterized protein n=1 Tax=Roseibium sediminicola TaxID=2933272 RepID=A0ABT0H2Z6_9HYPH|nr:hypothetical protein [Roseibium sp. CAU 1639]MCK7616049.1 hypothetical protein [Roseibium sp. CAU 1639]